jgi:hypothetical protein
VAARASHAPLPGRRNREWQPLAERRGSGLMQGRTYHHLDGLQIETTRLAALRDDHTVELVYFSRDLLADRFGRFFSSGVRVSSTGRKRQICSLTSTSSWPSLW